MGNAKSSQQQKMRLLIEAAAYYGRELTESVLVRYLDLLDDVPAEIVDQAIRSHQLDPERGRFFPLVADIRAKVPGQAKLSADEAWAVCLKSMDEWATVVVSDVIMAARAIALPILESGDKIGARMAFREAYDRILTDRGGKQGWYISLGFDKGHREEVALQAVQSGMISMDDAIALVPDLRCRDIDEGQKQITFQRASIQYQPRELDS